MPSAYDFWKTEIEYLRGRIDLLLLKFVGVVGSERNPLDDAAMDSLELRYRIERLEKIERDLQNFSIPHDLIKPIDDAVKILDNKKSQIGDKQFIQNARVHLHALAEKAADSMDEERALAANALKELHKVQELVSVTDRQKRAQKPYKDLLHIQQVLQTLEIGLDDLRTILKKIAAQEINSAAA